MTAIDGTNIIIEPDLFSATKSIESRYGIYKARLSIVMDERFDRIDDFNSDQVFYQVQFCSRFILKVENV